MLRGHSCRPPPGPDPWRHLLAAIVWRAVQDARQGDAEAAGWLVACGAWLAAWLGLPDDAFSSSCWTEDMPRTCTVCSHPERAAINAALVNGESLRNIAERFGTSATALHRHKAEHLPAALTQATEAAEVAQADDLLAQVRDLQRRTLTILQTAERAGDLRVALAAIGQARGNLELLARLLGELQEQQIAVQILVASPEWLRVRAAILTVLDPYPAARLAVAEALHDAGG